MTLSIAARCPHTGQVGVAAITHMIGIGKILTHARPGVGAIATQGEMNPYHGIVGLERMREGRDLRSALEPLVDDDPGRDFRQTAGVSVDGSAWACSGAGLPDWKGHRCGRGWSVQGNRLIGPEAVDAVARAFEQHAGEPFTERLLRALEAGHEAGADRAGERSSSLYVMADEEYPLWDIRVDQSEDPVVELRRLHGVFLDEVIPVIEALPSRATAGAGAGGSASRIV